MSFTACRRSPKLFGLRATALTFLSSAHHSLWAKRSMPMPDRCRAVAASGKPQGGNSRATPGPCAAHDGQFFLTQSPHVDDLGEALLIPAAAVDDFLNVISSSSVATFARRAMSNVGAVRATLYRVTACSKWLSATHLDIIARGSFLRVDPMVHIEVRDEGPLGASRKTA
jgi:hypothetical protein